VFLGQVRIEPMEYELDRPAAQYLGIICGQFVDRILSTQPTTNGKEWERV